ncbi:TetR/AcrR family transcriptional regulator [Nonomuraea sp. NPDC050556]|uniref:TetR/AcrR family transcriptional regulator n=1 Tax=Nonomuraea sp. NPDC050556 TaxID=3364369 RepID=UPI00379A7E49
MGNREDLLAGAKRCLLTRGYARTSVRDIATEAGVSMAAIGYHYGSREALLTKAVVELMDEWGDGFGRRLAADPGPSDPYGRFEHYWTTVIESFREQRVVWAATMDAAVQAEHVPELRKEIADGLQDGRMGLAHLLAGASEEDAQAVGSFYQALFSGVMMQWVVDPSRAPSAADLARALRVIVDSM